MTRLEYTIDGIAADSMEFSSSRAALEELHARALAVLLHYPETRAVFRLTHVPDAPEATSEELASMDRRIEDRDEKGA